MTGVVVIDKPSGVTSHDVVAKLRRIYRTKRVGHTGTLDPLATGVLVACIGQATRIAEYLAADSKEYVAGVVFGIATDTQDTTGSVLGERDASGLTAEAVETALAGFRGSILQTPPMVSAVHHQGRRLYELAREGIDVERAPRPVEVFALDLLAFEPSPRATAELRVACSTGTYIRTLAADIGDALGTGAAMVSLRRTRAGAFTLDQAHTLEDLAALADQEGPAALSSTLRPIADALAGWERVMLSDPEVARIRQGQTVQREGSEAERVLLLDAAGAAIALARRRDGALAPFKVLAAEGNNDCGSGSAGD